MKDVPWPADAPLFGSGRDALAALVRWGAERSGWRRVLLPSYYCPEVPETLLGMADVGVAVLAWPDHDLSAPLSPAMLAHVSLGPGDVLVVANQLGLRSCPDPGALAAVVAAAGAVLVEDHSHDPASAWARASRADFAFASLRKTLPLPDGGVAWSPQGRELPPEPEGAGAGAGAGGAAPAGGRFGVGAGEDPLAAALGRRSVDGAVDPGSPPFRALARSGAGVAEPGAGGPISSTSRALLPTMPVAAWRSRRERNHGILASAVRELPGVRVLPSQPGGVAFALTLGFRDPADRERVRRILAARAVAPAVIWPLDTSMPGVGPADAELSARLLSIHCDQRYTDDDMRRLGRVLREALGGGG